MSWSSETPQNLKINLILFAISGLHFHFRVKSCGAEVMTMDQRLGIEPFHENWGEDNPGDDLDEVGIQRM